MMIPEKVAPAPQQAGPSTKSVSQQVGPSTVQNGNKLKDAIESLAGAAVAKVMGKTSESSDMSDVLDVSMPFTPIKGVKKPCLASKISSHCRGKCQFLSTVTCSFM